MESFFEKDRTEQLIEQIFVKDGDIDGENYVEGSQGQVKILKMVDESDVDRVGGKFVYTQSQFTFSYGDEDFPTKPTNIEKARREVSE